MYRELWPPGRELSARCRRTLGALPWARMPLHQAPSVDCCCGIYAVASAALAAAYLTSEQRGGARTVHRVIGTVSLWGRVVEAERGWRSEHAYPASLLVPAGRLARLLAAALWPYRLSPRTIARELELYGVPVALMEAPSACSQRAGASAR